MGLEAAAPLNFSQLFCLFRRQEGPSGQASTTPMESVINRHLLQSNFIRVSSQSTENNKVYSTPSHKIGSFKVANYSVIIFLLIDHLFVFYCQISNK
jgi:hypothetical protein